MASITASVDAVHGVVWLEIDYASDPAVTSARIIRVVTATGEEENVRIHSWLSDEGIDCITLVGSSAATYDTEAPLDIPVYYRLEDCAGAAASVDSAEIVVPSSGRFWLKDPLRPYNNVPITQKGDTNPCIPVNGVYFRSMSEEVFPGAGAIQRAVNRRNAVAVVRLRHGYSSVLNLATRQFVDRDAVREILSTGDVLFLQGPAAYGIPEVYIHVPGSPAWQRLSSDHKKQWRIVSIPFDEVDRPAGLGYGILGTRWADMCDVYDSFADMEAAGISWRDVMAGLAGDPNDSIVAGWRTYAMVEAEFATYAAIAATVIAASDTFTRVEASTWGIATSGQAWVTTGGVAANFSVNGTQGLQAHTTLNVTRNSELVLDASDLNVLVTNGISAAPTGGIATVTVVFRYIDANNFCDFRLFREPGGAVTCALRFVVDGAETNTGFPTISGVTSASNITIRVVAEGTSIQGKAWLAGGAEPAAFNLSATVPATSVGRIKLRSALELTVTNVLPLTLNFDDFSVTVPGRTYQELLEGN